MAELDVASLRTEYSAFLRPGRLLLTGHSHQAWPDCARDAQAAYFDDAARFVDDKWGKAIFPKMESVASRLLARMGFPKDDPLAFGKSSHELVFRLLSCLRWADRPRIVTTTSEFHSLHRQLSRLAEEGAEIVWVDGADRATLCERLVAAIDERTALVAVSAVMFEDAFVLPELAAVVTRAVEVGAIPLIDAYHAFNVVPLSLGPQAHHAFVVAGASSAPPTRAGSLTSRASSAPGRTGPSATGARASASLAPPSTPRRSTAPPRCSIISIASTSAWLPCGRALSSRLAASSQRSTTAASWAAGSTCAHRERTRGVGASCRSACPTPTASSRGCGPVVSSSMHAAISSGSGRRPTCSTMNSWLASRRSTK
jgi:hypothetical protein